MLWQLISLTFSLWSLTVSLVQVRLLIRSVHHPTTINLHPSFIHLTFTLQTTQSFHRAFFHRSTKTAKMAYHQEYYLEDFDEYANERIPNEYNALKTCPAWTMEFKTIRDGDNILKRVPMLLVGRYHTSHGRQDAWAWATSHSIHYFHAHRGDEFVGTIDNLQKNRVYYRDPLTWAVGYQDTMHGMTKSRHTTKALAELLISFMFLLEDKILSVPSSGNSSLLSDFEYACKMFVMRRDEARNPRNEYFPYYGDAYGQVGARGPSSWRSGGLDTSSTFSTVKDEPQEDDAPSSRLFGSPYRATTFTTPKRATDTASSIKSRRHDPYMRIKRGPRDDEGAASVSWTGSSYISTPSRAPSSPYLGMFAPHASNIRSGSRSSNNPFRLKLDHVTAKSRLRVSSKSPQSLRILITALLRNVVN